MKVALVNSRKPKQIGPDERWLRATMVLGKAIAQQGHALCSSVGTIGYECALFGAAMGGGHIEAFVAANTASVIEECLPSQTNVRPSVSVRFIEQSSANADVDRDRAVMDAADLVIGVAIRSGGHMQSLLLERLAAGKLVQVVPPWDASASWRGNQRLIEAGAALIAPDLQSVLEAQSAETTLVENTLQFRYLEWNVSRLSGPTLAHFTRAATGPWPGQTRGEYLEDLWYGGQRARRDGQAALSRILRMGKLLGSARLIRGGQAMVSLTAAAPDRLSELHRYRPHLVRWDFEPWGIVFDRDWLVSRGARAVRYLPGSSFRTLPNEDRPWFQKHEPPACDYRMEEEWRVLGDLDFSDAPREAVRIIAGV